MTKDIKRLSNIFNVLSNDVRLCILLKIMDEEKNVTSLQECANASQSVVSQQLSKLKLQGFIKANKVGNEVYYSIIDDELRSILEYLYENNCK